MDSEDEHDHLHDHDHDHDHDQEHHDHEHSSRNAQLTGFLFGNIDKRGELIDDVLDEVRLFH